MRTQRWEDTDKRFTTMLRLLSRRQRWTMVAVTSGRVAMGVCDLLLAYAMYALFFLLQNGRPAIDRSWLPKTVLSTAIATLGLVVGRMLADLSSMRGMIVYTQSIYADLTDRLVSGYHEMRWNVFTQRNRSELLKHATTTALDAAFSYQLLIELTSSSVVVLVLSVALVYQSPAIALGLAATMGLLFALQRYVIRARLQRAATDRERSARSLQAVLIDIFSSAKEIRTYRNERFFHDRVAGEVSRLAASNVRLGVLPQLSRLFADQGVVAAFLCILIVVSLRHTGMKNLLSLLVLYFVLSRRLLPLISQIGLMLGMTDGAYENVQIVEQELRSCAHNANRRVETVTPDAGWALQMERVRFGFEAARPVLEDVTFGLRDGEAVLLCGVSGGGKSSLLNLVAGICQADAGVVRVEPASVAYVPQEIALLDDSVRNNLLFGLANKTDQELMEALEKASLDSFIAGLPLGLETRVGDNGILFSGGQRQRLGLARAVLRAPKLLLLDEATSALDEENEREILRRIIVEGGPAVLLVTHREQSRWRTDGVYRLQDGRLMEQTPAVNALS